MNFPTELKPDEAAVLAALGYGGKAPDAKTAANLAAAANTLAKAARPRWTYAQFDLLAPATLVQAGFTLPGDDIATHLQGCHACFLLALTMGDGVERATRAAESADMALAVLMDVSASVLCEQYADEAESLLRREVRQRGEYMTGRFSPGYGDLPIGLQPEVLRLLNTQKTIGLTASADGIMLPRKSITAVLGLARHPVEGHLAGCENCALNGRCAQQGSGGCNPK